MSDQARPRPTSAMFVDVNAYESPLSPSSRPDTVLHSTGIHLGRRIVTTSFNTGVLDYMEEHPEMIDHFLPTDRYASEEDRYRAEQAAQSVARIKFYRIQNMNKTEWERVEDKKKNRTLSRAATSSRPHSAAPSLFRPPSRVASSASNASTDIFASLSTTSTALPSRGPSVAPVGSYLGTLDGIRCRAGYSNHTTSASLQFPKIAVRAHIGSHTISRPTPPE